MVDGQKFNSSRVIFGISLSFEYLYENYINTDELTVYYKPENHKKSVLVTGFRLFHAIDIFLLTVVQYGLLRFIDYINS